MKPRTYDLIYENAAVVGARLVEPLARFMTVARDVCGGDCDKALILLVIVHRASADPDYPAGVEGRLSDKSGALPSLGTNVRSIAVSTGIPRETVRRKVAELVEVGWVVRKGRTLYYSKTGYTALEAARLEIIRMAAAMHDVVQALGPTAP